MDGFEYAEAEAVRVLGIQQVNFRAVRKTAELSEGADWMRADGRVMYSEAGLKKAVSIMANLTGSKQVDEPEGDWIESCRLPDIGASEKSKKTDGCCGVSAGSEIVLRSSIVVEGVVRRFFLNKKLLEAQIIKNGHPERVRVRVKSSENFVRGMKIKIRPVSEHLYELIGRCPRYRGRW